MDTTCNKVISRCNWQNNVVKNTAESWSLPGSGVGGLLDVTGGGVVSTGIYLSQSVINVILYNDSTDLKARILQNVLFLILKNALRISILEVAIIKSQKSGLAEQGFQRFNPGLAKWICDWIYLASKYQYDWNIVKATQIPKIPNQRA